MLRESYPATQGWYITNAIITINNNILNLASLRILNLSLHKNDLIIDPAGLLRPLGLLERLRGEGVVLCAADVELGGYILGYLAHGLGVLTDD